MVDERLLGQFNRVALAVSGGKDSMALLHSVAKRYPSDFFYVVNIEHGIRGAESRADSDFVEEYARSLGVECTRYDVDAVGYSREHGYTLEQGARLLRREIFAREVSLGRAERVAVAHHMDDNVESVLMHIFRGSGMRGLRGMTPDNGTIIRPLLAVTRNDIDRYIEENNIPYREDSTNADNAYRRNFIRHEVMPLLESRYPLVGESIMRLSRSASDDDEYLMQLAKEHISRDGDRLLVDVDVPAPLFSRAIYLSFSALGVTADVEERHYRLIRDLRNATNGTTLDMPYGVMASLEYGKIALFRQSETDMNEYPLDEGESVIGDYIITIESADKADFSEVSDDFRVLYVDADKVQGACVRTRRAGDTFNRYKAGNKKLKDYLIDIKLPRSERDLPLIVRGSEVLVVSGIEISSDVMIDSNTKKIYKIKLRRNAK